MAIHSSRPFDIVDDQLSRATFRIEGMRGGRKERGGTSLLRFPEACVGHSGTMKPRYWYPTGTESPEFGILSLLVTMHTGLEI